MDIQFVLFSSGVFYFIWLSLYIKHWAVRGVALCCLSFRFLISNRKRSEEVGCLLTETCQYSTYQKYSHWHSLTRGQSDCTVCLHKVRCSHSAHTQPTTAIYSLLFSVETYIYSSTKGTFLLIPNMSPKVRKFPLAGWLAVSHVQRASQDPVPSVILRYSANPSHLYVSSHAHCAAEAANAVRAIYHTGVKSAGWTIRPVNGLHFSKYK